jgi:hypothetical protein
MKWARLVSPVVVVVVVMFAVALPTAPRSEGPARLSGDPGRFTDVQLIALTDCGSPPKPSYPPASDKAKAKKAAAAMAVCFNDVAAGLGLACAFGGLGFCTPAALAWYAANRCQKVANDPPRNDFDVVELFDPLPAGLQGASDADPSFSAFGVLEAQAGVAMSRLLAALERLGGIAASATSNDQDLFAQLTAGSLAARAAAGFFDQLAAAAAPANLAWTTAKPNAAALAPAQLVAAFRGAWNQSRPTAQSSLKLSDADFADVVAAVDAALTPDALATKLPDVLVSPNAVGNFGATAVALRRLADEFDRQLPARAQPPRSGSTLSRTGGAATLPLLATAGFLLALGAAAVVVARRRRPQQ